MSKPRLLSGIKPTGDIHIGNYFGAMRQFVELQDRYESYVFIADLHALNQIHDPKELSRLIREIAVAYLAIGLDPQKVALFQQSTIAAHSELTVMLNSICSMGLLERAHAYKDAQAKGKPVNVGLFDYPVLMAADILLYQPNVVPVGNDQQQHVEIAHDLAERYNHLFGQTFKLPQALILEEAGIVTGLDGRKMSKSYGNVIGLFDSPEALTKKAMSIVTDSRGPSEPKDPDTCSVFALHRLVSLPILDDLRDRYLKGAISYKESKEILAANLIAFTEPIRAKKAEIEARDGYVADVLADGRSRASKLAEQTLETAKRHAGLNAF
jgi:tryptophanyl-tRNA synthetase